MLRPGSVGAADCKSPNRQRAPAPFLECNLRWFAPIVSACRAPPRRHGPRAIQQPCLSRLGEQYLALKPVGVAKKRPLRRAEVVDCAVAGALVHQSRTDGVEGIR